MYSIILGDGKKIYCKAINREKYKEILSEKKILSKEEGQSNSITRFEDGSALIIDSKFDSIIYYKKYDDLIRIINEKKFISATEFLYKRNPYGINFPSETFSLCKSLLGRLNINTITIDKFLLEKVDEKINKEIESEFFRDDYYIHQIALVGESLIQKYNFVWQMNLADDSETYNPLLSFKKELFYLYEDIFKNICVNEYIYPLIETYNQIEAEYFDSLNI